MENEISTLLKSYPTKVNWIDVVDFVNLDERLSAINCLVTNTIDVSEGFIEFIPDSIANIGARNVDWAFEIN